MELAGATPAFVPALLVFNEVLRRWQRAVPQPITVPGVHAHVVIAATCCTGYTFYAQYAVFLFEHVALTMHIKLFVDDI